MNDCWIDIVMFIALTLLMIADIGPYLMGW